MSEQLTRLLSIMAHLRDPQRGCEWDVAQTFKTIAPYTIEEAYEVADAIDRGDMADLRGELGDLLLQVVFHARMAEEAGHFDFHDVARAIADKMEARHPHVFGDEGGVMDSQRWEDIKAAERAESGSNSTMDGVARALPALLRAEKLLLAKPGAPSDGEIAVDATVEAVDYQGQAVRYFVRAGDMQLQAINMIDERPFAEGAPVSLRLRPRDCAALPVS